jgi:hypothetical protein
VKDFDALDIPWTSVSVTAVSFRVHDGLLLSDLDHYQLYVECLLVAASTAKGV